MEKASDCCKAKIKEHGTLTARAGLWGRGFILTVSGMHRFTLTVEG